MNPLQNLPELNVDRYRQIHKALHGTKSFWEETSHIHHTAMLAMICPGSPSVIGKGIRDTREQVAKGQSIFSATSSSFSYMLSSLLFLTEDSPAAFDAECKRVAPLLRAEKLGKGGANEQVAVMLLRMQQKKQPISSAQIKRFASIFQGIKKYHPFLTNAGDYPSVAVMTGDSASPEQSADASENIYEALGRAGLTKFSALQAAANFLTGSKRSVEETARRFMELKDRFKAEKVSIFQSDYFSLALLCFFDNSSETIVNRVQKIRERLAGLKPGLGKNDSFLIASLLFAYETAQQERSPEKLLVTQQATIIIAISATHINDAAAAAAV